MLLKNLKEKTQGFGLEYPISQGGMFS